MESLRAIGSDIFRKITAGEIPELFWHYTSQPGAMGIVQSNSIWATDIRFLNDEQEFAYTVDLARDVLRSAPNGSVTARIVDTWQAMLEFIGERPFFVASFCEQEDVLSQWRAYSGGSRGIALGFDATTLMQAAPRGVSFTTRCVYDAKLQRQILTDLLSNLEAAAPPGADISDAAAIFFQTLHVLATSFKHPGFSEEQEYRIAFNASHSSTDFQVSHRAGRVGITPYVSLPLSMTGDARSIREVVVGPTPHAALAVEGTKSWLRASRVTASVRGSRIPHRDW